MDLLDLEDLLAKVDQVATHLPPRWRVRANRALIFQHLNKASEILVDEEDESAEADRKQKLIVEHYKTALQACLPCRSECEQPWCPSSGTNTSMVSDGLEELSNLTQAAMESAIGDDVGSQKVDAFQDELTPALQATDCSNLVHEGRVVMAVRQAANGVLSCSRGGRGGEGGGGGFRGGVGRGVSWAS